MIAFVVLLLAVVSDTSDAIHDLEDSCLAEAGTAPNIIHPEYLPTKSRLRHNLIDSQNHYDVNFPDPLASSAIENYCQNTFVLVEDLIPTAMLDDCLHAVDGVVDRIKQCKVLIVLLDGSVLVHKLGILYDSFINVLNYDNLLGIAAQLQSNAVDVNPIRNLWSKLPQNMYEASSVHWHQDIAYFGEESWHGHTLTLWIPLLDIKISNGAMQFINKGHLLDNIRTHTCCFKNTWYVDLVITTIENEISPFIPGLAEFDIDETSENTDNNNNNNYDIKDFIETVEMRKGSVLLFSSMQWSIP